MIHAFGAVHEGGQEVDAAAAAVQEVPQAAERDGVQAQVFAAVFFFRVNKPLQAWRADSFLSPPKLCGTSRSFGLKCCMLCIAQR